MAREGKPHRHPRGEEGEITSPGVVFAKAIHYNVPIPTGSMKMDDAIDPALLDRYNEESLPYLD